MVGNGIKSLAVNLAGVKASAKDGSLSLNKTALTLQKVAGIDVFADKKKTQMKDMTVILDEVAQKWGSLNDKEKKGLSEALGGKQQAAVIQALLSNWKQYKNFMSDYNTGQVFGSAEKENARFIDSIEGRLNTLKETMKELVTNTISTDMFKNAVSGATKFAEVLNSIVKGASKLGSSIPLMVATLGTMFTSIRGLGSGKGIPNLMGSVFGYGKNMNALRKEYSKGFDKILPPMTSFVSQIDKSGKSFKQALPPIKDYNKNLEATKKYSGGLRVTGMSNNLSQMNKEYVKSASGISKVQTALTGLGKGLLSTAGNALLFAGVTAAISFSVQKVSDYINRYEIALEEHKNKISKIQNEINGLETKKDSMSGIAKEYDELSAKTDKTAKDFERLSQLKREIANIMPELVMGEDSNGDPLLAMSGSAQSIVESMKEMIQLQKEMKMQEEINAMTTAAEALEKKTKFNGKNHLKSGEKVEAYKIPLLTLEDGEQELKTKMQHLEIVARTGSVKFGASIKEDAKEYNKAYSEYTKGITDNYNKVAKETAKVDELVITKRKGLNNLFLQNDNFKNLGEGALGYTNKLNSMFNIAGLDNAGLQNYVMGLTNTFVKNKGALDPALGSYIKLREEFNKTGEIGKYENGVKKLIPALMDTTSMTKAQVKEMLELPASAKTATSALDAYLMTFDKRAKNVGKDQATTDLAARFKAFENLKTKLTAESSFQEIDGKIKFNPEVIMEDKNVPAQIKNLVGALQKDGDFSDKDYELLMRLVAVYEMGDTPEGKQARDLLQKDIDKSLGKDNSVDIGNIQVKGQVDVSEINTDQLNAYMDEIESFKGDERIEIRTAIIQAGDVGVDELEKISSVIDTLPTSKEMTAKFIVDNLELVRGMESYEELEQHIKDNPELALQYKINVQDDGIKELQGIYDTLPKDVQTLVNTKVIGTDKLDLIKQLYNEFPDNKDLVTSFILNNPDALNSVKDWNALVALLPQELKSKFTIETEGTEEAKEGKKVVDEAKDNNAKQEVKTETTGTEEAKESKKTVDDAKGNSAQQNVETTSTGKEEAKQNKDTVDSAKGNTAVQTIVTRKEGDNPEEVKNQLLSTNGATATTYIKLQTEGQEETSQAKQQVESLSGMNATAQIELQTTGLENGEKAEQTVKKADGKKAKTSIEVAMEGVDKVNQALQQVEKISGKKIAPLVFNAKTDVAARNISGLISRISQFERKPKSFTTNFRANTSGAAKNISGLMRKIDAFKASYTGTITTNFVVNTSYTTSGSPPSSGGNNGGKKKSGVQGFAFKTASLDQPVTSSMFNKASISTFADYPEESMAPMMRSGLTTLATPVSIMPKASNLLSAPRTLSSPLLLSRSSSRSLFGYKPSIAHDGSSLEKYFKNDIEFLKELEAAIKKVTNAIGLLDTKMKNASASDKVKYLQEQNKLYVEQQRLIKEQVKAEGELQRQKNWLLDNLKKKGFKFDNNTGNMLNYEELLRNKADALNKAEEKANKKNAKDADKDKYEKLKKEYDEMKKMADAYFELEFDKIPKLEQEWEELNNKRIEAEKEIKKLQEEAWQTSWDAKWASADKHVKELNNELAMVDILMKNAYGTEKDALIKRKIELLEKQKQEMKDTNKLLQDSLQHQKAKLIEFGFKFNNKGDIINYAQQMEHLQQTSGDFEEAKKYAEEYLNLFVDKIPDANNNLAEMNNKIKEAYKQQLEITKSIEDQITKMYEKQVEERKKLIEKELKAKVDALNKQKEAYNEARKEADYQKDYDKQLESVSKLQKQLDIAKRDTSLSGQKKVKELLEKLKEEQEKLQDMVQDKIDDDVNNMIDKEIDKLEDEAEKNKEDLDEKYNKENIQKWVQEALNTGMFTDIDGKVTDLKDSMLDFTDKWGEGLGATGDIIKGELIANLEIARDIMKDMDSMKDKLGLTSDYYNKKTSQDYLKETMDSAKNLADAIAGMRVQQNAPLVYVEGNVDKGVMPDLTNAMKKAQEEFANKIVKNMKV
nr:hypothetical protein [Clostridioides sp.]